MNKKYLAAVAAILLMIVLVAGIEFYGQPQPVKQVKEDTTLAPAFSRDRAIIKNDTGIEETQSKELLEGNASVHRAETNGTFIRFNNTFITHVPEGYVAQESKPKDIGKNIPIRVVNLIGTGQFDKLVLLLSVSEDGVKWSDWFGTEGDGRYYEVASIDPLIGRHYKYKMFAPPGTKVTDITVIPTE